MDDVLTPYGEAIKALFARTTNDTKPGLERTLALLAMMDSPHEDLRSIHVAGTNGKGSVVATADALLRATGLRVGRYTSPHLIDFRERITVNGAPIPEENVLAFLERYTPAAEKLGATFFELTTALAFDWFIEQEVDIAVVETGLGGRLDSTNVLSPEVAVVTSIAMDHADLLGSTLPEIAREKAGIFKRGIPAVIGEPRGEIQVLLARAARDAGAEPVIVVDDAYQIGEINISAAGTAFSVSHKGKDASITTPLIGRHQARNTSLAIAAVNALGDAYRVDLAFVSEALKSLFLPGRFQRWRSFIFDVAHNPAGMETVADSLRAIGAPSPRTAVVAILADKSWEPMILALATGVDRFVFTNAPSAPANRVWDASEAYEFARDEGLVSELEPDLGAALARAEQHGGTVLITGSFHTVGDAMSRLQVSPFAA
ncbi:MAG: folylpolyglutamate synthase/dihydrofolate synthase family protein [Gemmatimonadaceae bacterium]